MLCLSLQFGLQPLFTQACIEKGSHKPTLVLLCEVLKCVFAMTLLYVDGGASGKEARRRWSYKDALQCAGVPAAVYAFQNICIQMAYQNMDPILFNLLNQTKIVFTAIMVYVLMGKKQTLGQCLALLMLMLTGIMLSVPKTDPDAKQQETDFVYGIVPCFAACVCSGFASAYSQMIMSGKAKRHAYLFSAELSFISALVLLITNVVTLNFSTVAQSMSGQSALSYILNLDGLTLYVLIPLLTNASGGIFVGQVTKHAGSVRKIFCVVCGIITTAISKFLYFNKPLTSDVYVAMPLVFASLYLYNSSAKKQVGGEKTQGDSLKEKKKKSD